VLILSDLLHFHAAHPALHRTVRSLLARTREARVYVAAGGYTKSAVCEGFVGREGEGERVVYEEVAVREGKGEVDVERVVWVGEGEMGERMGTCRLWVGRWECRRV
jgi:nicotinamide N-methyltransferase